MRRTQLFLDDIGDLRAPKGSREWASAVRHQIQVRAKDTSSDQKSLRHWIDRLKQYRGWEQLEDKEGRKFDSFDSFSIAPAPYGLGYSPEALELMVPEVDTPENALEPLIRIFGKERLREALNGATAGPA